MTRYRRDAAIAAAGIASGMLAWAAPAAAQGAFQSIQWSATNGIGWAILVEDRYDDMGMYAPVTTAITNGNVTASALLSFVAGVPGDGSLHTRTDAVPAGASLESGADVYLCEFCVAHTSFTGNRIAGSIEVSPDWYGINSWFVGSYSYTAQTNGLYAISGTTRYFRNYGSAYGGDAYLESAFQFNDVQIAFAGVPEPASWLTLIGGFALAGGWVRARRSRAHMGEARAGIAGRSHG